MTDMSVRAVVAAADREEHSRERERRLLHEHGEYRARQDSVPVSSAEENVHHVFLFWSDECFADVFH